MRVPCPSGLIFEARKWKIGDQAELLDLRDSKVSNLPKKMLSLAATGIVEPGPYDMQETFDVNALSMADIAVANILIRVGTDPLLRLRPTCGACRKPLKDYLEINLAEMPIFMASSEGSEHLRTGTPVERRYGDVLVKIKAIRGKDLEAIGKLQEEQAKYMLEYQMAASIAELRAPGPVEPLIHQPHIREFLHEQPWNIQQQLEADIDELFGGVDQSFTFQCDRPSCLVEQEQQVPLDLTFYGLDLSSGRYSRRKRSSAKSAGELMRSSSPRSSSDSPTPPTSTSED